MDLRSGLIRGRWCSPRKCVRIGNSKMAQSMVGVTSFLVMVTVLNYLCMSDQDVQRQLDKHKMSERLFRQLFNGIVVQNLTQTMKENTLICRNLNTDPVTPICMQDKESFSVNPVPRDRTYNLLSKIQTALRYDQSYTFIDVGANFGYYTLVVANMGHKVVAVETLAVNVNCLQKAANMAHTVEKIILLRNPISNVRREVNYQKTNATSSVGGDWKIKTPKCVKFQTIYLNDLADFISSDKAILRLNINGHEIHAMQKASKLFKDKHIPYVFMEFSKLKMGCFENHEKQSDVILLKEMIQFFTDRSYIAHDPFGPEVLMQSNCSQWPSEVIWIKGGNKYPIWRQHSMSHIAGPQQISSRKMATGIL